MITATALLDARVKWTQAQYIVYGWTGSFDDKQTSGNMSAPEADNFYMYLSKNPIRFEPVSSVTSVFFDDSNRQVSSTMCLIYRCPSPAIIAHC